MKCYHGSQKEGFCKDYHNGGCIRYDEPCDYKSEQYKADLDRLISVCKTVSCSDYCCASCRDILTDAIDKIGGRGE